MPREVRKLEVVTTYLEMLGVPAHRTIHPHTQRKLALLRAEHPPLHFYRYLYERVGEPWLWWERRLMDDDALSRIIHDEAVEIFVMYADGCPAGFVELDRRTQGEVELVYFGLVPDYIGQGLGLSLLDHAVNLAWMAEPQRVWVHTCNLDHPRALLLYQRVGFSPYRTETKLIDDPRDLGIFPAGDGG
jgi:GNAT superfamily N-acetyltransferase